MFYSGEELAALQYPPVVEQVKKRCRWLLQFSKDALSARQGEDDPLHGAEVDANALGVYWCVCLVCFGVSTTAADPWDLTHKAHGGRVAVQHTQRCTPRCHDV